MSKEAKNEIDLMLRQLGGRGDAAPFESDEQHLDADELNSYVANALPATARARYMEHLADCGSCRRLVAQLSAAQGPVVVASTASIPASSGLKQFLASLLSPMVLRYAVPALGVLVIMAVGFVVMRRGPAEDRVSKLMSNSQNGSVGAPASQAPSTASPESKFDKLSENQPQRSPESRAEKPARGQVETSEETAPKEQQSSVAVTATQPTIETPAAQPLAKSTDGVAKAPAFQSGSADTERRKASDNNAAEPPPAPKKVAESVEVRQREVQREDAPKATQTQVAAATPGAATNRAPEVRRLSSADAKGGERNKRARDEAADKTTAKDDRVDEEKNEAAAETRSVAGRRFRKSGKVWIDTAFNSSLQMFSMSRGSEQYRTLVGDEPEIRKIAEELDGEFIVVWKGRAYRIR